MTEPPIEEPTEDWLEQQTPIQPTEQPIVAPELPTDASADEADLLEQDTPLLPEPEDYSEGDPSTAG